jgi:hypothetical protein
MPVDAVNAGQSNISSKSPVRAVAGTVMVLVVELADVIKERLSSRLCPEIFGIIGKLIVVPARSQR